MPADGKYLKIGFCDYKIRGECSNILNGLFFSILRYTRPQKHTLHAFSHPLIRRKIITGAPIFAIAKHQ
jgi:hypothetical protein